MIPLLTALANALTEACKAYVSWVAWTKETTNENTLYALEDEKIRLGNSGTPADKLRIEVITRRARRLERSSTKP